MQTTAPVPTVDNFETILLRNIKQEGALLSDTKENAKRKERIQYIHQIVVVEKERGILGIDFGGWGQPRIHRISTDLSSPNPNISKIAQEIVFQIGFRQHIMAQIAPHIGDVLVQRFQNPDQAIRQFAEEHHVQEVFSYRNGEIGVLVYDQESILKEQPLLEMLLTPEQLNHKKNCDLLAKFDIYLGENQKIQMEENPPRVRPIKIDEKMRGLMMELHERYMNPATGMRQILLSRYDQTTFISLEQIPEGSLKKLDLSTQEKLILDAIVHCIETYPSTHPISPFAPFEQALTLHVKETKNLSNLDKIYVEDPFQGILKIDFANSSMSRYQKLSPTSRDRVIAQDLTVFETVASEIVEGFNSLQNVFTEKPDFGTKLVAKFQNPDGAMQAFIQECEVLDAYSLHNGETGILIYKNCQSFDIFKYLQLIFPEKRDHLENQQLLNNFLKSLNPHVESGKLRLDMSPENKARLSKLQALYRDPYSKIDEMVEASFQKSLQTARNIHTFAFIDSFYKCVKSLLNRKET